MKAFISLTIVLAMLLATGCQKTELTPMDTTVSNVTNAEGDTVTINPDVTVSGEEPSSNVTTTESNTEEIIGTQSPNLNEPISTEGMTEWYLSYVAQSDKDGNAQGITSYTYDKYGNITECTQISGDRIQRWVYEYDKNGFISKEMYFSGDLLVEYFVYTNDSNGNVTSMRHYSPNGNVNYDDPALNYERKYDSKGRLTEIKNYVSETEYNHETCEYNEAGNMTRRRIISSGGMLISLEEKTYDEQGRLTTDKYTSTNKGAHSYSYTTSFITQNGKTTATTRHTGTDALVEVKFYDADGILLEHHVYDESGVLFNKHVYEHQAGSNGEYQNSVVTTDADGRIVLQETTTYAQDGTFIGEAHIEYTYDADGTQHITSTVTTCLETADGENYKQVIDEIDGELFCGQITWYDDNGNITKITTELSGTIQEEIYERNADGNLVKLIRYVDGEVVAALDYEFIRIEGAWHRDHNDYAMEYKSDVK